MAEDGSFMRAKFAMRASDESVVGGHGSDVELAKAQGCLATQQSESTNMEGTWPSFDKEILHEIIKFDWMRSLPNVMTSVVKYIWTIADYTADELTNTKSLLPPFSSPQAVFCMLCSCSSVQFSIRSVLLLRLWPGSHKNWGKSAVPDLK